MDMKEIVKELIIRKQAYFSEYRRTIIDYELTETSTDYHLSTVSTLKDPPLP